MAADYANYPNELKAPKEVSIYQQHESAVTEWHVACREFRAAEARKAQAKEMLDKLSHSLAEHLQRNMCDPTEPQQGMQAGMQGAGNGAANIAPGYGVARQNW